MRLYDFTFFFIFLFVIDFIYFVLFLFVIYLICYLTPHPLLVPLYSNRGAISAPECSLAWGGEIFEMKEENRDEGQMPIK